MKPEWKPTNKVSMGAAVGALVFMCCYIVESLSGTKLDASFVVAAQTVAVFIAQWAVRDAELPPKG